jgi:hypothetical protein
MKRFISFFAVCALACLPLLAQTTISEYRPGVTTDGAVYFLPRTAIRVSVLVEKTSYTPGDFASYAQRYLRLNDVSLEPQTSYRVVGISQTPFGVADQQKGFSVKFNAKTVAANVALADDGRLLSINAEPTPEVQPQPFEPAPKGPALQPRRYMNEEILAAGSTAKMAELTSREIYDLRENRSLLIKGQADFMPQDGAQLKLMLAQIDEQEKALTTLFQGTTVRDTSEYVINFVPEGPVKRQHLFRLSQQLGLVDADDLSGAPYYISIEDLDAVPATDLDAAAKTKKKEYESGVYVNVPGRMRSTIYAGIDQVDQKELPAAQFGNVELLSADLFNKHYTTRLWVSPVTGAVERLDAEMKK